MDGKIAYVTDVGQVGPYAASLWVEFDSVIHNFKYPNRKQFKLEENGPRIFNSVLVKLKNFSPVSIERVDVVRE
jgi:calcineurin-like phosphoesterase